MDTTHPSAGYPSRREFLSSSGRLAGAGWLALHLPALSALAGCSREAAERDAPFRVLSPTEGDTLGALAEVVVPSGDGGPGAREAGVVHFIDGALGDLFPDMLGVIRPGVEDLNARAGEGPGDASAFAELPEQEQARVVREVEDTPFFFTARMLVVMGMFSDPEHGGNRDGVGWELLGMSHAPAYEPPFGHYDAQAAAGGETGETP